MDLLMRKRQQMGTSRPLLIRRAAMRALGQERMVRISIQMRIPLKALPAVPTVSMVLPMARTPGLPMVR